MAGATASVVPSARTRIGPKAPVAVTILRAAATSLEMASGAKDATAATRTEGVVVGEATLPVATGVPVPGGAVRQDRRTSMAVPTIPVLAINY